MQDIYDTINHEVLHYCLKDEDIDDYMEHDPIFKLQWIDEYIPIEDEDYT